jgi:hypothetical protein
MDGFDFLTQSAACFQDKSDGFRGGMSFVQNHKVTIFRTTALSASGRSPNGKSLLRFGACNYIRE